jgi:hypothetical protein
MALVDALELLSTTWAWAYLHAIDAQLSHEIQVNRRFNMSTLSPRPCRSCALENRSLGVDSGTGWLCWRSKCPLHTRCALRHKSNANQHNSPINFFIKTLALQKACEGVSLKFAHRTDCLTKFAALDARMKIGAGAQSIQRYVNGKCTMSGGAYVVH